MAITKEQKRAYDLTYREVYRERKLAQYHSSKGHPRTRWLAKRRNAKHEGVPFDLPLEFFENMPTHCPQCGVEFTPSGTGGHKGPTKTVASIDRDIPVFGYVVGNCEWICNGCNTRKNDQSWAELLEFAQRGLTRSKTR